MTFDLSNFSPVPYAPNVGGKPTSQPIALCTPFNTQTGPKTLRVDIPWTLAPYSASGSKRTVVVDVDLAAMSTQGGGSPLDAIRFCKIDNTFNDVPVYARFTDTGDVILCPANSIIGVQVQSSNQKVQLFGTNFFTGRTPTTSYFFSNAPQQPFYQEGAGRYAPLGSIVDMQYDPNNATVFNYTAQIGRATTGLRMLVLFYGGLRAAGVGLPTLGATIDGAAFINLLNVTAPFGAVGAFLSMWVAYTVTTATSFALQLSSNVTLDYSAFSLYTVMNNLAAAPFDSASDYAGTVASPVSVLPLSAVPGSFACYATLNDAGIASPPYAYGGAQLDGYFSNTNAFASYSRIMNELEPATLSVNQRLAIGGVWI